MNNCRRGRQDWLAVSVAVPVSVEARLVLVESQRAEVQATDIEVVAYLQNHAVDAPRVEDNRAGEGEGEQRGLREERGAAHGDADDGVEGAEGLREGGGEDEGVLGAGEMADDHARDDVIEIDAR